MKYLVLLSLLLVGCSRKETIAIAYAKCMCAKNFSTPSELKSLRESRYDSSTYLYECSNGYQRDFDVNYDVRQVNMVYGEKTRTICVDEAVK